MNQVWGLLTLKPDYKARENKILWFLYKDRHTDQWNRIKSPERNSYICDQLIFNKGAKKIQWAKIVFSTSGAEATGYPYIKEWSLIPISHHIFKKYKLKNESNSCYETSGRINLLEGINLHNLELVVS